MAIDNDSSSSTAVLYVIVVVVAVLVASVLSPVVWTAFQSSGDEEEHPSVAVITLRGATSGPNVAAVSEQLREARTDDSVAAVVLRIDSPGGGVTSSEEFYLQVNRTATEMPVVAYVEGSAASGGYFGIAPADAIYVKPSSLVGSIGVRASITPGLVEQQNDINRQLMQTGPDKAVTSVDSIREELELLQNAFTNTVMTHRGDQLTLSREEVEHARVYRGTEAVENGFADRIGTLESAIERAAAESGRIDGGAYDVDYRDPPGPTRPIVFADGEIRDVNGSIVVVERDEDPEFVQPVEYYYVYGVPEDDIPQTATDAASETEVKTDETS